MMPKLFSHLAPQVDGVIELPTNSKQKRQARKAELMAVDPRCFECGRHLTPFADEPNSAHLVRGSLSCPGCVNVVRKQKKTEKLHRTIQTDDGEAREVQLELTPKAQKWLAKRRIDANRMRDHERKNELRRSMVQTGQRCDVCDCELSANSHDPNYAHLVMDRKLSCADHVKVVERRLRMADVSERVLATA